MRRTYSRVFPELDLFPSKTVRRQVVRSTMSSAYVAGGMAACLVLVGAIILYRAGTLGDLKWFGVVVVFVTAVTCGCGGFVTLWRKRIRRRLRIALNQLGVRTCLQCGYDLRGLTESRCPECGTPFEPGGEVHRELR